MIDINTIPPLELFDELLKSAPRRPVGLTEITTYLENTFQQEVLMEVYSILLTEYVKFDDNFDKLCSQLDCVWYSLTEENQEKFDS